MKLPFLPLQLAIAAAVIAFANMAISRLAENSLPRQLLRKAELAEPATDLFLGNSTMAAGLDEDAFSEAAPGHRPLNLGLGATDPVEHFLIYRGQEKHAGSAVFYGYFDRQLTDPPTARPDSLLGNRAMAYYVEPPLAAQYYADDSVFREFAFRAAGFFPAYVERSAIWGRVERARRSFAGFGMPERKKNRFGRVEDFDFLETAPDEFAIRCRRVTSDRTPLSRPVVAILSEARERGSTVYFVEMPMPSKHRKLYNTGEEWIAYRSRLAELIREAGAIDLPACDWVPDGDFDDAIHLNKIGARLFSTKLNEAVRIRP